MWVQIDISSSCPSTLCRSTDHQYMWNSFIRVFKVEQPVDVFACIIKSSCIGSSIIDVFVSQNVVKSVNPILTVTWHLSYHPPVSIYSGKGAVCCGFLRLVWKQQGQHGFWNTLLAHLQFATLVSVKINDMRISWRNSSKKQKRGQYGTHLESSAKMKSCSFTLKGAFRQKY